MENTWNNTVCRSEKWWIDPLSARESEQKEEEPLSEARELENMLKSFETDLNCCISVDCWQVVDSIHSGDEMDDFNIEEYEKVLEKGEHLYCCLFQITTGKPYMSWRLEIDKMKCILSILCTFLLVSAVASSINSKLSFSTPFTDFTHSGRFSLYPC